MNMNIDNEPPPSPSVPPRRPIVPVPEVGVNGTGFRFLSSPSELVMVDDQH